MTEKEMSEIFSVMLLAYPNAECFKGGKEKLLPTIKLWQRCCIDVDFWTAQRAVYKLVTECKFPPTIAEFLENAKSITKKIDSKAYMAYRHIKAAVQMFGEEKAYEMLEDDEKQLLAALGGLDKIVDHATGYQLTEGSCDKIMEIYTAIERAAPAFPSRKLKEIGLPNHVLISNQ